MLWVIYWALVIVSTRQLTNTWVWFSFSRFYQRAAVVRNMSAHIAALLHLNTGAELDKGDSDSGVYRFVGKVRNGG